MSERVSVCSVRMHISDHPINRKVRFSNLPPKEGQRERERERENGSAVWFYRVAKGGAGINKS